MSIEEYLRSGDQSLAQIGFQLLKDSPMELFSKKLYLRICGYDDGEPVSPDIWFRFIGPKSDDFIILGEL